MYFPMQSQERGGQWYFSRDPGRAGRIVIELKYAEKNTLEASCEEALEQIERKNYEVKLLPDGMRTIYKYGIACWKKECRGRTL